MTSFLEALQSQIGAPYRWAADSPSTGFDCSGLVKWGAEQIGVSLPHHAATLQAMSQRLGQGSTGPGDLAFKGDPAHHVMVCLDAGCAHVIQAPKAGDVVHITPTPSGSNFGRIQALAANAGNVSSTAGAPTSSASSSGSSDSPKVDITDPVGSAESIAGWAMRQGVTAALGGHDPAEIGVRGLEVVLGGAMLAAGIIIVMVIVSKPAVDVGRQGEGAANSISRALGVSTARQAVNAKTKPPAKGKPRGPGRESGTPDPDDEHYQRTRARERSEGTSAQRYKARYGNKRPGDVGASRPGPADRKPVDDDEIRPWSGRRSTAAGPAYEPF